MNVDGALEELRTDKRFELIKEYLDKGKSTTEILKILNAEKNLSMKKKRKRKSCLMRKQTS